jgi:2-oxoisovalerate dehydrogenase E1 component
MTTGQSNFLRDAYLRMATIRAFEARATELTAGIDPAILGSIHPCAGQEAIPVGAMSALDSRDRILATYRGHGWALEAGIRPDEAMAEMCQRTSGINGGRAGSLMMMAPTRGFIGENSIVGAGGPIACGVALGIKAGQTGGVVAVSFGDGAMSQGGLHEALVTAKALMLPVLFICENNEWAEMTPSAFANGDGLAERARGYGIASETVDGCDPEAVRDAVMRAASRARKGEGPTFLECRTVRLWGHYNRDVEHYRSKENRNEAERRDPLTRLADRMIEAGLRSEEVASLDADAAAIIERACASAVSSDVPEEGTILNHLFGQSPAFQTTPTQFKTMTYAQAVNAALRDAMLDDEAVMLFGEDVAIPGGVFGMSRGLLKEFGDLRVIDTPIAETAILGMAVGAAIGGRKPIAEIMFSDFLFVAFDQIINQAANVRYVSNGLASAPLVIRTQQGVTPGSCAQHAQCVEAHLANIPGIKVGLPITPNDAYAMLRAAVADPDPCVIIEARSVFMNKGEVMVGGAYEKAEGARLLKEGSDVGIIAWGTSVMEGMAAADGLADEGISVALLDLRWLSPIDDAAIGELVRNCRDILVVHEASRTGGFGAEICTRIVEQHGHELKGSLGRLAGLDIPMPSAPNLQRIAIPTADRIAARIREVYQGDRSLDHLVVA